MENVFEVTMKVSGYVTVKVSAETVSEAVEFAFEAIDAGELEDIELNDVIDCDIVD